MFDPTTREYTPDMLAMARPKIIPPHKVRHLIRPKLLECSVAKFIERLPNWSLIPFSYGHLEHQEMIELFTRIDTVLQERVASLKKLQSSQDPLSSSSIPDQLAIEHDITKLLKGTLNALDITKEVKYVYLFKSLDIVLSVIEVTTKIQNLSHSLEIFVIYRTIIKANSNFYKNSQIKIYLEKLFNKSVWYSYWISKLFLVFFGNLNQFLDKNSKKNDIFSKFPLAKIGILKTLASKIGTN